MTRVQIEALVSGDFVPIVLGPGLVCRLNHAWSAAGQRLHMLHVEVVNAPVVCPRCLDRALYRRQRRGLLQKRIYPLFGIFPWSCMSCRQQILLRLRSSDQPEITFAAVDKREQMHKAA